MFSLQQLIKTLRSSSGELVKYLKHAASVTPAEALGPPPPSTVTSMATTTDTSSQTTVTDTALRTHQQQQQQEQQTKYSDFSSQQTAVDVGCQTSQTNLASGSASASASWHTCDANSLDLSSNEVGHTAAVNVCNTQDPSSGTNNPKATTSSYLRRSQQIQKFYQHQLHNFSTQHNPSLYAKQKQSQFSMSSLAVEPIDVKQDEVGPVGNGAGSSGSSSKNGSDCQSNSNDASSSSAASAKPCFNTGLAEIVQFMELIGNLKHTKRTGWVLRDVSDCESISGHMYRMSMMTFLLDGSEGLNQIRCMELALVHDLAESLVGDITPFCGVSRQQKRTLEFKAMDDICKLIEPRGKRIMELFEEYENGETAESKFVKDLDRLDMVMQAFEYEKRDDCVLRHQEFFDSTEGKFNHPFVKKLVNEIYEQRESLAKAKGVTLPVSPTIVVANGTNGHCTLAEPSDLEPLQTSTSSS